MWRRPAPVLAWLILRAVAMLRRPTEREHAMARLVSHFKYVRYAMGSMTAVLFAVCAGAS